MDVNKRDLQGAYFLARVGFGINIALHGWSRIPKMAEFLAHTQQQFAHSILPAGFVRLSSYGIVAAESTFGPLLILGLWTRFALAGNSVLMWVLLFGTCLIQNWSVAGDQLIYLAFLAGLLATASYNHWSCDRWLRRGQASPEV